jgi:hypothetical protein
MGAEFRTLFVPQGLDRIEATPAVSGNASTPKGRILCGFDLAYVGLIDVDLQLHLLQVLDGAVPNKRRDSTLRERPQAGEQPILLRLLAVGIERL